MTNKEKIIGIALIALVAVIGFALNRNLQVAQGSAPSGLTASHATSSTITAATGASRVAFATSTNCASRVMQSNGTVRLKFADDNGLALSATVGFRLTATSSLMAFDSGIYGCGQVTVWAEDATTVITVSEFR